MAGKDEEKHETGALGIFYFPAVTKKKKETMQISHRGKYTFLFNAVTYVCRTVDVVVVR